VTDDGARFGIGASAVYDAITSAPAAFFADYAAQADYAAEHAASDESRAGALTACNQLYRKREAEDANLHWIFLPFEWEYNGYSGVIRVLFDAARKKIDDIQHPLAKSIRVKKQKNNDLLNGMQQN
jgi:hypothetical protein